MDVNDDCQLIILDKLGVRALVSMAESNTRFLHLAKEIFRCKYSKRTFKITNTFETDQDEVYETSTIVRIVHFEMAQKILKYFGHLIENLDVTYWLTRDKGKKSNEISELINLYCSESLIDLVVFKDLRLKFFENMERPFKKVENLKL